MKAENYINVVLELNDQIKYNIKNEYSTQFNYITYGLYDYIMFGSECLYDGDNDGELSNEYELKEFVINQFKKYRKYIKGIKLKSDTEYWGL